jgi:exopolyphosphatase/guanosine-5'-triphosphate,3'-diphosphate pyrophosphatase
LGKLLSAQSADRLRLPGMKDDRRPIIGGGLSIVRALFDLLQIDQLEHASGGLRHGLLYDLTGGEKGQTDIRAQSIQRLASKFGTDRAHGERVAKAADHFLEFLLKENPSPGSLFGDIPRQTLGWAALLHEIGSHVSHSDHHKHGAYILSHADAMGFSISELQELSMLVLGQKGKLKKIPLDFENESLIHQLLALRLGVAVCHARRDPNISGLTLAIDPTVPRRFNLTYPASWAESFPQSAYLLREEPMAWQRTPWALTVTPD